MLHAWQAWSRLSRAYGGIAVACTHLVNNVTARGVSVTSFSFDAPAEAAAALDRGVRHVTLFPTAPRRLGYCADLDRALASVPHADVVHVHGLWRLHYAQLAAHARRRGVPLIVSAHGMLHARALAQRQVWKQAARVVFQNRVLEQARCLHATSPQEVDEIRRAGYRGPVALVPWGVDAPMGAARHARPAGAPRRALFLGRIHPAKGVDVLLRAWARIERAAPEWDLEIAGYDESNSRASLEALAAELRVSRRVRFSGPAEGPAREALFAAADLVVLPSPAENFGFVVAEALARGLPVIATHGAPWPVLATERCGWWVAPAEQALADALGDAVGQAPEALRQMGERGRRYAAGHLTWHAATDATLAMYNWARGVVPRPDFIHN